MELYLLWHKAHGIDPPKPPKNMLVVEDDLGIPMAMGGLVVTDSDYCFIDCLVTKPGLSEELGKQALFVLTIGFMEIAEKLDFEKALFIQTVPWLKSCAKLLGAKSLGPRASSFVLYKKDLEEALHGQQH
jgi:hypothetical protein